MAEKNSKRVYAGYYDRYDGKLIYVVMVTTDIDSGEKLVICQYADYTNTGEYYTVTKQSFCEQVEWRGQMVNKYSRRVRHKIDRSRINAQEDNALPGPKRKKPKQQSDEFYEREYRQCKDYHAYAKDLCEHYLFDWRKHQLCLTKKKYVCITKEEYDAMTEDLAFLQHCLKTILRDYNRYFKERFVDGLSIRKYAEAHDLNRGSVDHIQRKLFASLAAALKARDEADGVCRLWDPSTAILEWPF